MNWALKSLIERFNTATSQSVNSNAVILNNKNIQEPNLTAHSSQINLTGQSEAFRNNGPGALTSLNRPVNNSNSLVQPVRNRAGPFESLQSNPIRVSNRTPPRTQLSSREKNEMRVSQRLDTIAENQSLILERQQAIAQTIKYTNRRTPSISPANALVQVHQNAQLNNTATNSRFGLFNSIFKIKMINRFGYENILNHPYEYNKQFFSEDITDIMSKKFKLSYHKILTTSP